jgi:hypothetical protein
VSTELLGGRTGQVVRLLVSWESAFVWRLRLIISARQYVEADMDNAARSLSRRKILSPSFLQFQFFDGTGSVMPMAWQKISIRFSMSSPRGES